MASCVTVESPRAAWASVARPGGRDLRAGVAMCHAASLLSNNVGVGMGLVPGAPLACILKNQAKVRDEGVVVWRAMGDVRPAERR